MKFKNTNDRFTLIDEENDNQVGYVVYKLDNNILSIISTFVNPLYQGKGMAKLLIDKVVSFSKEKNYKIKPICSYSVAYFEKHPEFKDLLIK
ncbi:MAG: GNAT family N-acetyltransferase [Bacilli bacterium]|jgi:uncharacterized protein